MLFSIGSSIGWGSFVVTSNNYLLKAGPAGSILGLLIGAAVMLIISQNYSYMMNKYPSAGGVYSYAKETVGYDYGFLLAWFLALTYIAIFWANATSIPLFIKYFLGHVPHFIPHYVLFDYEICFTEVFITIITIFLTAVLCKQNKKVVAGVMIVLTAIFTFAILFCTFTALFSSRRAGVEVAHAFLPDTKAIHQILFIAFISPWAFIGFENVSHHTQEFAFSAKKSALFLRISVIITTLLYVAVFFAFCFGISKRIFFMVCILK